MHGEILHWGGIDNLTKKLKNAIQSQNVLQRPKFIDMNVQRNTECWRGRDRKRVREEEKAPDITPGRREGGERVEARAVPVPPAPEPTAGAAARRPTTGGTLMPSERR